MGITAQDVTVENNMNKAIVTYDPKEFEVMTHLAKAMVSSGYFNDAKEVAQAIVKIQAGKELGLPAFASMTGIHIIQGKPVLGANVLATLVKNDPRYDYKVKVATNELCELTWFENGQEVGPSAFSMVEAKAANLNGKDNWKRYPSDMLFARAISRGARRYAPGIFGGSPVYTPDEMGADVDEEGNVIVDSVAVDVPDEPTPEVVTEPQPELLPTSNGDIYQAVEDAKLSTNAHAAKAALQNYCKTGYDTEEKAIAWMRLYRGWKDSDKTTQEAADLANEGKVPK
jgi:hypothetical protein